ncbi:MAG: AAA family ATPase [Candidatus Ranarchaeia archaeon]
MNPTEKNITNKILIGIVGMPGAGKTTAIDMILDLGASVVAMGDVIREEAKSRGLELTRENLSNIMFGLREKEGPMVVAKRCLLKIDQSEKEIVIIDGLRSLEEVEFFKKIYRNFEVILIHAKERIRFERILERARMDDPKKWEDFHTRDLRELKIGIGYVIALSDYIVSNNGSLDELRSRIVKHFKRNY